MLRPEPGQSIEVTVRGRVVRLACHGRAVLIERADGSHQWFDLPDDLLETTTWRPV